MALEPGDAVTDSVKLVKPLGEGGMGSVWVARHDRLDAEVAVKFMSPELAERDPSAIERFEREAALSAKLKSPHAVKTFDYGVRADGRPYIVMELLDGETLGARLERKGALPADNVVTILSQVAAVLSEAHELGVVHRDIKPDNIFLVSGSYKLFVKVLDFGIAKQTAAAVSQVTDTGTIVGTPEYMSPEQLLSTKNADYRSDVWALAVLAYHCLTGRVPFRGETLPSLSIEICGGRFRPPSELVDGLSTEYDDFFERAFQPDADGRFGSVRVLADTFRGLVRGAPQTGSADTQRRPTEPVGEDLAGPTMPSAAAGERHRSSSPRVMVHDAAEDPQGKDRRPPPDGTARAGVGRVNDSGVHEAVQAASADESGRRMAVGDTLAAGTSPTFSGAAATLEPETQQDRRRARYRLWAVLAAALVLVFAVDRALSSRLSDDPAPGATPRGDTDAAHPAAQATADIPTRGAEPEPPASAGVKAAKSAAPLSSAHAEASASAVPTERGAATSASVRAVAAPSPPAPVGPRPRRPAKPEPTTAPKADKSKPGCDNPYFSQPDGTLGVKPGCL